MADRRKGDVEVLDESVTFTLYELCQRQGLYAERVVEFVNHGVLSPREGRLPRDWRFGVRELRRLQRAVRLQRDLEVNLPGLALSLDLLEELSGLRREVNRLERQLAQMAADEDPPGR